MPIKKIQFFFHNHSKDYSGKRKIVINTNAYKKDPIFFHNHSKDYSGKRKIVINTNAYENQTLDQDKMISFNRPYRR